MEKPKLARVFWLSVLTPAFCNIPHLSTVGSNQFPPAAIAAEIRYWEYDPYTNELQITSEAAPNYFILADPPRIAIDVPNSNFGTNPIVENYSGLVRRIRISQFKPGETRIVMDLDPTISLSPAQVQLESLGQGNRWVLRPQIRVSQTLPSLETPSLETPSLETPSLETTQTWPQLPGVNSTATVPIDSDIGLPTQQVTPTAGGDRGNSPGDRPVTVTVPNLNQVTPEASLTSQETEIFVPPPPPPESVNPDNELSSEESEETEAMPPLPPYSEWQQVTPRDSASASVITFGESLPKPANQPNVVTAVNSTNLPNAGNGGSDRQDRTVTEAEIPDSDLLVAAGTMMILRYPGSEGFALKSGSSRREVLLVDVEIYDRNGRVVAPVGTPVVGRFESDRSGSRFVVESMAIDGQMVPVVAESDPIAGDRTVSRRGIISWSTLGAVGGAAIGGLAGGPLLGGAAAGVAANLLSAPKQTAIEPGQIIPVRAIEHWRSQQP